MDQIDGCEAEEGAVSDTRKPADGGHEGCQRPRGRHECQVQVQLLLPCSCDEKQRTGTLVQPPTLEFQNGCQCRLAGSHLFLGWCLELTAAAASAEQHHVRHRPPCCAHSPNHHIALDHAHRCAAAATYIHPHYTTNINRPVTTCATRLSRAYNNLT